MVGFEYRFGIARHLQAIAYRTAIDKTFQFYGKYDALRQSHSTPVASPPWFRSKAATTSRTATPLPWARPCPAPPETASRCTRRRSGCTIPPRSSTIDRDTFFVGVGGRLRVSATVYVVAESSPRLAGYSPGEPEYAFGFEKRAGGHMFQLTFANGQGTTFAQTARGGPPTRCFLGSTSPESSFNPTRSSHL